MYFQDREDAGRKLALKLNHYANDPTVLVLGLARGGVPVAAEVAKALDVPLDVFIVRKLGLPGYEEIAYGAIASGGIQVCDSSIVKELGIPDEALEAIYSREFKELQRRERVYRGGLPAASVTGRTIILVDDGIATGSSMRAAIVALRPHHPARVVAAVPVAPPSTLRKLEREADEVVCLAAREDFRAVGEWYDDFRPPTDEEVTRLLASTNLRVSVHAA
jgi:putative phosphoribosyl transferase